MGVQKGMGSEKKSTDDHDDHNDGFPKFEDNGSAVTVDDPGEFNLDVFGGFGFTWRGKVIENLQGALDHIITGRQIDAPNGVITYNFNDVGHLTGLYNNPNYGFTAGIGFSEFTPEQRDAARQAIQYWDDLAAVSFRESNGQGSDIIFSNSSDPGQAYAYYPLVSGGQKFASDVFIRNPSENWTNEWFSFGGYGNTTLIHEIGHTLGLSHPGNYNGSAATTYAGQAEYAQDSTQYTIMSYWAGSNTNQLNVNWSLFLGTNYAQTPMLHDIAAIQAIYGADMTTRSGDTVYGFNSTAGRDVFDFNQNSYPNLSIWDGGGNDTIDASGFTASQFINLHAGSFSSVGDAVGSAAEIDANRVAEGFAPTGYNDATVNAIAGSYMNASAARIQADTGVAGIYATGYDTLSIAYGATIENAIGGSARDLLWGNEVANVLNGMGGDDVLNGFEGADTLTGGSGNDTFVFEHLEFGDTITDLEAGDEIDLSGLGSGLFLGGNAFTGAAGEVIIDGTSLMVDMDGDGNADFGATVMGSTLTGDQLILA